MPRIRYLGTGQILKLIYIPWQNFQVRDSRIFWKLGNVICQSIRSNQHASSKKSRSISRKCYFLFSSRNHPASGSFASISRFSGTAVLSIKLEDLRFSTISRRHSLLYLECTCQFRSTFVSSLKKTLLITVSSEKWIKISVVISISVVVWVGLRCSISTSGDWRWV